MIKFQNVNRILARWDPIGVGEDLALEEYKSYVPQILNHLTDEQGLITCLENILITLQIGYKPENQKHVEEVLSVCKELMNLENTVTKPVK